MNSERIPTIPQNDERIPTIPQTEERIPTLPQSNERIATVPQGDRIATVPQEQDNTVSSFGKIIQYDCTFDGYLGGTYTIKAQQVISDDSGESQIYGCLSTQTEEKLVARVLKSITPTSSSEKIVSRQKVIDFLIENSKKPNSHILPLLDHGILTTETGTYFVEIYPFCQLGDLGTQKGNISYQTLCEKVIPGINEALHTFHNAGFVHCDVKPDNLYWYKDEVVLGDFGIVRYLRGDGFTIDKSKTGTLGYYAPELMSSAALTASDYYSFGQTLWTLYSGEMMYQNILRRYQFEGVEEQRNQINFSMMNGVYYGFDEIIPEESFFEILIRGLLQYDPSSRFDYEKVNLWLTGDKSLAHQIAKYNAQEIYKTPFIYKNIKCWDNSQLYEVLHKDWEYAKELLYSGTLKEFFLSHDYNMAMRIDKIMRTYSKNNEVQYDIGLAGFFMYLNGWKYLAWRGVEYRSIENLTDVITENNQPDNFKFSSHLADLLGSGLVEFWYSKLNPNNKNEYICKLLQEVQSIAKVSRELYQRMAFSIYEIIFSTKPGAGEFKGCKNIDDVVKYICETKANKYNNIRLIARSPKFYAFLYTQGYFEFAGTLFREKRSDYDIVEYLYTFLEKEVKDSTLQKQLIEYYKENGPMAYMLWLQNNLDLYQFNGDEAKTLRTEIENYTVSGNSIMELRQSYAGLKTLVARFRSLFVDNIYQAKLGITNGKEKNGITSNHLFAYWHKTLYSVYVPIGFDTK